MLKPILLAFLICSCVASKPVFPTDTKAEQRWEQEYRDGKLSWSEYQSLLKGEKDTTK